MQFNDILNQSAIVHRFAALEALSENDLYELYFESFCSYIAMFRERLKLGKELRKVLVAYKDIEGFGSRTPEEVVKAMFVSPQMHRWFAYRFIFEIDNQLTAGNTNKNELANGINFASAIPTKIHMQDIINETNNEYKQSIGRKKERANSGNESLTGTTGNKVDIGV